MARVFPFNERSAQYVIGTGDLFFVEHGDEIHLGNASLVDLSWEGSTFRVFTEDGDEIAAVDVTTAYRLIGRIDSFSLANLGRLIDEPPVNVPGGTRLNLTTIRKSTIREVLFEKDLTGGGVCRAGCPDTLRVRFWRAHLELPGSISLNPTTIMQQTFGIVALPDDRNHELAPFGYFEELCDLPAVS